MKCKNCGKEITKCKICEKDIILEEHGSYRHLLFYGEICLECDKKHYEKIEKVFDDIEKVSRFGWEDLIKKIRLVVKK